MGMGVLRGQFGRRLHGTIENKVGAALVGLVVVGAAACACAGADAAAAGAGTGAGVGLHACACACAGGDAAAGAGTGVGAGAGAGAYAGAAVCCEYVHDGPDGTTDTGPLHLEQELGLELGLQAELRPVRVAAVGWETQLQLAPVRLLLLLLLPLLSWEVDW